MFPPLFIGRFQPFHLGHLDALKQIFQKHDRVIIGIGSAEDDFTPENPFTAGERYQMIEASLLGLKIGFAILPVRNIRNYSLWVKHVESLLPPFGEVYTESPIVRKLFLEDGKHPVKPIAINLKISATEVRKKMLAGKNWEKLVPEAVVKLIKKWKGIERLKELS